MNNQLHYRIDGSDGESDYEPVARFTTTTPIDDLTSFHLIEVGEDGKERVVAMVHRMFSDTID